MKRFTIGGGDRVYSLPSLNEITLADIMLFNTQVADFGLRVTWHDIEQAAIEMSVTDLLLGDDGDDDELEPHALQAEVLGATLWLARRHAGESITFDEAVDILPSSLKWLPDPEDRKPSGKGRAAKKGRRTSAQAASSPAGA